VEAVGKRRDAVAYRAHARRAAGDDSDLRRAFTQAFAVLLHVLVGQHDDDLLDFRDVEKGLQRPFDDRPTEQGEELFGTPHAGPGARGDDHGARVHGLGAVLLVLLLLLTLSLGFAEDHAAGRGLQDRAHRDVDALADVALAFFDDDHRTVVEIADALLALLAF